jgi:anti-sigma B factor antagonist
VQTETKATIDEVRNGAAHPVTVMRFSGDISSTSREVVLGSFENLPRTGPVLLDFSRVDYINSSGIALVIQLLMEASKSGQKIALFGLTPHFKKVFTMVGIIKYAPIYPDQGAALAALD